MDTLIGDGGHARDIVATLPGLWKLVKHHAEYDGDHRGRVIIGVNDPALRAHIAEELEVEDSPWIHPHAYIGPECRIGDGTHVNYGVTMTRTTIGKHCTIAPGVTICGDVTIGDRVFIGAGAVVKNLVVIPDDTFIKMGTMVTR